MTDENSEMPEESGTAERLVIVCVIFLALNVLGFFWLAASMSRISSSLRVMQDDTVADVPPIPLPPLDARPRPAPAPTNSSNLFSNLRVPGIAAPVLCRPREVDLPDDTRVIGIEVNGEPRAYVIEAFEPPALSRPEDLAVHVVNDVLGNEPIVVTYCDRTHSTRVLTRLGANAGIEPADVCIGGFDSEMLLVVDDSVYSHHSADVPLADVPFTKTTWDLWLAEHPDTLVYTGHPCES